MSTPEGPIPSTIKAFYFPPAAEERIAAIAEMTDRTRTRPRSLIQRLFRRPAVQEPDCAAVLFDALRIHEWAISQQANGRTIQSLNDEELTVLDERPEVRQGTITGLVNFILPERLDFARRYFNRRPTP